MGGMWTASFETAAQYVALTTNVHCTEHLHELVVCYFQYSVISIKVFFPNTFV